MTRYLIHWPLWLAVVVARYPLAVIAVLLWSSPDNLRLTRWRWLETIDNTLIGDPGWRAEHMLGRDPFAWYNRIGWLWRNGGNRFNYEVIGCRHETPAIDWPSRGPHYTRRPDGYWQYRRRHPLVAEWSLELFFGWALDGPQGGRCKYVCTVRLKTKP